MAAAPDARERTYRQNQGIAKVRLSEHHEKVNAIGVGKCSVPMWSGGAPAGFCDKDAYGPRLPTVIRNGPNGAWAEDGGYSGFVSGLACPMHGGPSVRVFMDGNMWCAVNPDFTNLQESPAGFGKTKEDAIAQLKDEIRKL